MFDGEKTFAVWDSMDGSKGCLHLDLPAAQDTVARLRAAEELGMRICMAHDANWMIAVKDEVLWSILLPSMRTKGLPRLYAGDPP